MSNLLCQQLVCIMPWPETCSLGCGALLDDTNNVGRETRTLIDITDAKPAGRRRYLVFGGTNEQSLANAFVAISKRAAAAAASLCSSTARRHPSLPRRRKPLFLFIVCSLTLQMTPDDDRDTIALEWLSRLPGAHLGSGNSAVGSAQQQQQLECC
jgi:hypothetical protein